MTKEICDRQTIDYEKAMDAVHRLSRLEGFVCLGPAPGYNLLSGKTLISAIPDVVSDPRCSLQTNFERLREYSRSLNAQTQGMVLPVIIGVLHYEAGYLLIPKLNNLQRQTAYPLQAGGYSWCLEFEHSDRDAYLTFHKATAASTRRRVLAAIETEASTKAAADHRIDIGTFHPLQRAETYKAAVERVREYIQAGDCYQVNLSQQFEAHFEGSGWVAFQALSRVFPTPQSAFVALGDTEILSLSPEIFIDVESGVAETHPIKGTRPRGKSPKEDAALALALQESEKDRAENLMIVDLLRNDLGRICRTGSVQVTSLLKLESYANVHHLVSSVTGRLKKETGALDALIDCFPGGSITGAPKIRAMEIIAELEPHHRGPYCGSVFRWDASGELHSNIAIRTLWREGNRIRCWGGGGIVYDSDPAEEYAETITKVRLLMDILEKLGGAES